jgi:hypothetical protein
MPDLPISLNTIFYNFISQCIILRLFNLYVRGAEMLVIAELVSLFYELHQYQVLHNFALL